MLNASIEATIDRVEQLYTAVTGRRPPPPNTSPIPPETDLGRHIDDQLERLSTELERAAASSSELVQWQPHSSAWRDDEGLMLAIDLPGVPRDQLELSLDDRTLVVRGRRNPPWGSRPRSVDCCETAFGSFTRTFMLPARVDPALVVARLEAGVLLVRVASAAPSEPSQIPIRS